MKLSNLQKSVIRKIFKDNERSQTVIDVIFQTQVYLLAIPDEQRRKQIINLRVDSLVRELRCGKNINQDGYDYETDPIEPNLKDDSEENNVFWNYVKTLLVEAAQWNYQREIVKESLKKKVFMHYLADPNNRPVIYHAQKVRDVIARALFPGERPAINKEFLEIEAWAQAVDHEYQVPVYPIKTSAALLLLTLANYGVDNLSASSFLLLATAEVTGAYLWGKFFPQPLSLSMAESKQLLENLNKEFLKDNKLKPVWVATNKEPKIVYTNFSEKLPAEAWLDEQPQEEKRPRNKSEKVENKKPKFQQSKERVFEVKKPEEDKVTVYHGWKTVDTNTKHVNETWGRYSQKNTFTFFHKTSPSIQAFKKENKELYKLFKNTVRLAHVVPPIDSEGIVKLEYAHRGYTYEAKLLGFIKGSTRAYGRTELADDGSTVIIFDRIGPALHK